MNDKSRLGDVVRLKSGGPTMTVNGLTLLDGVVHVECVWFHASFTSEPGFKPATYDFAEEALNLIKAGVATAQGEQA